MTEKLSLEAIRQFWTRQAEQHGASPDASWSDRPVIEMEIRQLLERLSEGDSVLDVGCANGYSTLQLAAQKSITIRGVDYVPEMIDEARARLAELAESLAGDVSFAVGDVLALDEPSDTYDKVIVVRVIINLRTWENQARGLAECARVLKPGGVLLLSEATLQGWRKMNALRAEWGLASIPMPDFNEYLDEERIIEALGEKLELVELVNFASTYFVGTRVIKPLLIQALGADIDVARPDMEWNRFFSQLPAWGDYGTQKLFVFRKQ